MLRLCSSSRVGQFGMVHLQTTVLPRNLAQGKPIRPLLSVAVNGRRPAEFAGVVAAIPECGDHAGEYCGKTYGHGRERQARLSSTSRARTL